MATVLKHFKHYYYNFGITLSLSNIYTALEKKREPIEIGIMFGGILGSLLSMNEPVIFVNNHRSLPQFDDLPIELQQTLRSMSEPFYAIGERMGMDIKKEFADLLKSGDDQSIKEMLENLSKLVGKFLDRIESDLKGFKEEYPE